MHSLNHSLTRSRRKIQKHTNIVVLNNFLVKGRARSGVIHERYTEAPFLQGTGNGNGDLRMDAATVEGELSATQGGYASAAFMHDITYTNQCSPGLLDKAAQKRAHGLDVAVSRNKDR